GPINYATAYSISLSLLSCRHGIPAIPSWMPLPRDASGHLFVGDNTKQWIKPFSPRVAIGALRELLQEWEKGIEILISAAKKDNKNRRLRQELNLAEHILLSIKSTINIIQFYQAIHRFQRNKSAAKRKIIIKQMREILKDELEITKKDKDLVKFDKRLGYHPEAHTNLFTLEDLNYKISLLEKEIFNWRF
ncbi:MAG: ELKS/Rab6-interacting/CAST family protein, partial [Candidatus Omnitrophica bacterium]|nr:ELKS/Rab6-interacting/CAST family protein [Candidatus Omnitrophota bacterium]